MRALPVGAHGLLLELDTADEVGALHAELLRRATAGTLPPVTEIVPAARTVFLDSLDDPRGFAADLETWDLPQLTAADRPGVEIPVVYDGPDLADVAALWGTTPDEVVRRHAATTFHVAFCGFAPGFGYLTGLPEEWHVPRRATPRTRVPVGAVALAGPYTGVYPRSSPGGWQLIGRTDAVLWDPRRENAALLTPGTRVHFVPRDRARDTETVR
ncbi:5-oxoprolinase subunit PxpB [Streptomyces sp. NBC_01525]|uniref:5-oxoprolinase subunit PxpB n=1 Tax=Streptomyces benahoarensis TaxID=2595054 RepID=A0A553ZLJ1_9ACTN|nr:5-oxoprolinase subunit PxpB [Streptomyces benahoarensis]TSB25724.1 5-oxoprolinase subunit PxpB [Streptomyces benahoarensis]TSB42245.1 5-oxoprolinase subunit PxpB [Streptomyces benahoarensis]